MPDLKQELTMLIDAFGTARATAHETLIKQSAAALVGFLETVQIIPVETDGSQSESRDGKN